MGILSQPEQPKQQEEEERYFIRFKKFNGEEDVAGPFRRDEARQAVKTIHPKCEPKIVPPLDNLDP